MILVLKTATSNIALNDYIMRHSQEIVKRKPNDGQIEIRSINLP